MSNRLTKHKNLYDKLMIKDNAIPETREEAFDLALILTLKGESYTGIVSDSKWNSSKHAQLLKQIMDGENVVPETRDEAVKLAIIRNHHDNGGSGGSVNLSNYYKKSQVDALLAAKADSTDLDDYYLKTQTYSQGEVDASLSGKVDKVAGKGLSQENYTSEEKTKLARLNNYDDTALVGRVTAIEGDYANKNYVNEQIANLDNLNKKIVDTLPSDSEADNNTIYMMKTAGSSGDEYEMYTKIDGTLVLIGNTSVDLTDYAKSTDIPTNTSDLTNDSGFLTEHQDISGKVDKVAGKGLSTNDFTDELKAGYDDAVSKTHTHSNKPVLDVLTQSVIDNSHNHINASVLNKFSEDSEGNPLYNGNGIAGAVDLTDYAKKTDLPVLTDLLDDSTSSTETTYSSSKIDKELADKSKLVSLTRAEYDALTTKDEDTYYIITDDHDVFSIGNEWKLLAKVTLKNEENTIVTVDNVAGCKEFTIISKLVGYDTHTAHITVPNISLKDTIRNLLFEPMSSNAFFLTTATFTNDTTLSIVQYIGSAWTGISPAVETKIYAR